MQQVEMKLGGTLLDMMNAKPWCATSFRLGSALGCSQRRIYQAANAAQQKQRNTHRSLAAGATLHTNTPRASRGEAGGHAWWGRS